jgi:methionine-R-sulfoxide reductase
VILHQGTERPFCGLFLDNKQPGTYVCRLCGLPRFESGANFESDTGWPSFFKPYDPDVRNVRDDSHGVTRVEIRCARCDAHLRHVFDDGRRRRPALLPQLGLAAVRRRSTDRAPVVVDFRCSPDPNAPRSRCCRHAADRGELDVGS